jgi:ribosomal protein S2
VIPGNDDAIRSCSLVARVVADGIEAGRQLVSPGEMQVPVAQSPKTEDEPAGVEAEPAAEPPAAETPAADEPSADEPAAGEEGSES